MTAAAASITIINAVSFGHKFWIKLFLTFLVQSVKVMIGLTTLL